METTSEPHAKGPVAMNDTMTTHVGLDVHRDTIAVSVRRPGVKDPENWTIGASTDCVRDLARRLRQQAGPDGFVHACYEAGPTGFGVQRLLESEGVACDVVAPSLIPVRPGERRSTDRLDANRLSEHLRSGLLTVIAVPTPAEEAARDLVRQAQSARRALGNSQREVQSFLLRLGVHQGTKAKPWTKAYVAWLASLKLEEPMQQLVLEDALRELRHRQGRVDWLMARVKELAEEPEFAVKVSALRCLRGIETYSAMVLATEILRPTRFPRARHLMSFVGLVVGEASSGLTQRKLGLTKTGNSRARHVLVEAAHHQSLSVTRPSKTLKARRAGQPAWAVEIAERAEKRLHDRHWALRMRGKPECKVIGAVARELTGFVWAMLVEAERRAPAPVTDEQGVLVESAARG